jgi:hypothetical protein
VDKLSYKVNVFFHRFLLAQLHLDSLQGKSSPKAIRIALKQLASGTDAYHLAYHDAMLRIESQIEDRVELAKRVLAWITCAMRPLSTLELQHDLAVEESEHHLDEGNLSEIQDMVSACGGLPTVDEENAVIRLVHYTAQDYFRRTQNH